MSGTWAHWRCAKAFLGLGVGVGEVTAGSAAPDGGLLWVCRLQQRRVDARNTRSPVFSVYANIGHLFTLKKRLTWNNVSLRYVHKNGHASASQQLTGPQRHPLAAKGGCRTRPPRGGRRTAQLSVRPSEPIKLYWGKRVPVSARVTPRIPPNKREIPRASHVNPRVSAYRHDCIYVSV